ncbi:MAG TPA: hypothetical protein PLU93_01035 [Treponemataceae bacterium]|nr:hypothetical protein [Treponemataceae bacterium]
METFNTLSPVIQNHVKQIAKTSGMPVNDETYESLAVAWMEKKQCFEDSIADHNFEDVSFFSRDEARGALALTYSGSLINIGPLVDGVRRVEYTSVGLRTDVPASAVDEASELSSDVETDAVVSFKKGPIQQSSPIFKIAISAEKLDAEEEVELLTQVVQEVTEDFVEVNKTIIQ